MDKRMLSLAHLVAIFKGDGITAKGEIIDHKLTEASDLGRSAMPRISRRRGLDTRANISYDSVHFNRPGTKLVRRWYGEKAAKSYNS